MSMKRLLLSLLLLSLSTIAFAQSEAPKSQSDAQKSFSRLKALEGTWEGKVTTTPPAPEVQGKVAHVSLRVTSMGNAFMHEMRIPGRDDDPITMFYMDG